MHDLLARAALDVLSSPDSDSSKANSISDALRFEVLSYFTSVIAFIGRQPEASPAPELQHVIAPSHKESLTCLPVSPFM